MKILQFEAKFRRSFVKGALIINEQDASQNNVSIETNIESFKNITLKTKTDINNPENLIASFISKYDEEQIFKKVTVEGKTVEIIRKQTVEDKTMTVNVIGSFPNQIVFDQEVSIVDVDGQIHTVNSNALGKSVIVPAGFQYTKDSTLNAILKYNVVPADYDRQIHNHILKAIQKFKSNIEQEYIFLNRFYNIQKNYDEKTTQIIIPLSLIKSEVV